MSKLAMMNRMRYAPAAGGPFSFLTGIIGGAGKLIGGLFKSKAVQKVVSNPLVQGAGLGAGTALAGQLMAGGGGGGSAKANRGASGGWTGRRSRGITARELRGYRKVANLIHKEGMVSKRARGRHS